MNSPINTPMNTPMTTQELIELAVLDAMGLLDEQERESFDAAFARAAPAIQAQVRREQTRLSTSEHLLPDVEPPAGLRAMVLDAVRRAMALPRESRTERTHRRARALAIGLVPARQVSPLWRAASVGFAAAAMVFGFTFLRLKTEFGALAKAVESDRLISEMQGAVGSPYVVALLTDPQTVTREFVAMPGITRGQARLWTHPQWGEGDEALLAMSNLPDVGGPLRVYTYVDGELKDSIHEFEGLAGFQMVKFSSPLVRTERLAIAAPGPDGLYQPIFITPSTSGLAWAGTGDVVIAAS